MGRQARLTAWQPAGCSACCWRLATCCLPLAACCAVGHVSPASQHVLTGCSPATSTACCLEGSRDIRMRLMHTGTSSSAGTGAASLAAQHTVVYASHCAAGPLQPGTRSLSPASSTAQLTCGAHCCQVGDTQAGVHRDDGPAGEWACGGGGTGSQQQPAPAASSSLLTHTTQVPYQHAGSAHSIRSNNCRLAVPCSMPAAARCHPHHLAPATAAPQLVNGSPTGAAAFDGLLACRRCGRRWRGCTAAPPTTTSSSWLLRRACT